MPCTSDRPAQLPDALDVSELIRRGRDSLRDHLLAQAVVAHQKHGPLTPARLDTFLADPACVRHPTRLVYEFGEMAMHQFAQPDLDPRDPTQTGRVLYLRPLLRQHPESVVRAVAYMVPVLNYGGVVEDEHCLLYGATLLGEMVEEFYAAVCRLADLVGAETRYGQGAP